MHFRGEKKSETTQRVMAQLTDTNKNYGKEGKKVLVVSSGEKQLFDKFLELKILMGVGHTVVKVTNKRKKIVKKADNRYHFLPLVRPNDKLICTSRTLAEI